MSGEEKFSEFPETVRFTGIGNAPMRHIHLISLSLVLLGIVFAVVVPPLGLIILAGFIAIAGLYDAFFLRRTRRPVEITLHLRTDPVMATFGENPVGEIATGTLETEMDEPNQLGFRPAPNKQLMIWTFATQEEAKIVAKRLLLYLPRDGADKRSDALTKR